MSDVRQNIKWGVLWGCGYALFFSIVALCLWLIALPFGVNVFAANDTSLGATLTAYWVGGLAAGIVVGIFRPWAARSYLGAAVAGGFAAVPVVASFIVAIKGVSGLTAGPGVFSFVVFFLVIGPLFGLIGKHQHSGKVSLEDGESQD